MLTCFTLSAGIPVRGERVTEVRWQELLQMCKGQESLMQTLSLILLEQEQHPVGACWEVCTWGKMVVQHPYLIPWRRLSSCMPVRKIKGRHAQLVVQSWRIRSNLDSKGFWVTPIPIYFHVTWAHSGPRGKCLAYPRLNLQKICIRSDIG